MAGMVTIYVEGKGDKKFITDYLKILALPNAPKLSSEKKVGSVIDMGGKDKLHLISKQLIETTEEGGINLIIFDADTTKNGGGYTKRREEIKATLAIIEQNEGIPLNYDIFLLPFNKEDFDKGALEDLLESIINPANRGILDCWKGYEQCLTNSNADYTLPAKKSKIYSYAEVLHGETKAEKDLAKDPNRNYTDIRLWDLKSNNLNPLKNFLTSYCK